MNRWHTKSAEEILHESESDLQKGLSTAEIVKRREQFGLNELVDRGTKSPWKNYGTLTGAMVVILIISAVIISFYMNIKMPSRFW